MRGKANTEELCGEDVQFTEYKVEGKAIFTRIAQA